MQTDFSEFTGGFIDNLVVAKPEAAVEKPDVNDMVQKGLRKRVLTRDAKNLYEQLADQLPMRGADGVVRGPVERRIECEQRTRASHAITGQMQMLHSMEIAEVELDARPMRVTREPQERIGSLSAGASSATFHEENLSNREH